MSSGVQTFLKGEIRIVYIDMVTFHGEVGGYDLQVVKMDHLQTFMYFYGNFSASYHLVLCFMSVVACTYIWRQGGERTEVK